MAYITLSKNNFFNNLDIIKQKTKSVDKIALVLKDNAYGHGLMEIAAMAKEYGITKAVVQNSTEAKQIEDMFSYILVLADFPTYQSDKIRYTINDIKAIEKFPKSTKVELKVDTGMHRNGIHPSELQEAKELIQEQGLVLEAIFTHHRSADELSSEWFWQKENFKVIKAQEKGLRYHSCNSAALFRHSEFNEDMARVGIAAYGVMELPDALHVEGFKPVLSLYASKISSRKVLKGQRVGYGATFEAKEECVVSNYDFGYGDGFFRICSNNYVTPQNIQIAGRVSMDNSSFICEDDELLIFDDARESAKFAQTISYEVLTSLKKELHRKII